MAYIHHKPETILEDAIKSVIADYITPKNIYSTWNDENPDLPCVTICVSESEEKNSGEGLTGNWELKLDITIISQKDETTGQEHKNYEGEIRDIIFREGWAEEILNASGGTCIVFTWIPTSFRRRTEDGLRISTQQIEVFLRIEEMNSSSNSSSSSTSNSSSSSSSSTSLSSESSSNSSSSSTSLSSESSSSSTSLSSESSSESSSSSDFEGIGFIRIGIDKMVW